MRISDHPHALISVSIAHAANGHFAPWIWGAPMAVVGRLPPVRPG